MVEGAVFGLLLLWREGRLGGGDAGGREGGKGGGVNVFQRNFTSSIR